MLDIVDTLPPNERDDKVALLYEMNKVNLVAVKTPYGLTERVNMPNIVMQGGKWGPLKCSNTIDKIGKKCVDLGQHLYSYKGLVKIVPLSMVDDLLVVNNCGKESVMANIYITSEMKDEKVETRAVKVSQHPRL